jgi:adenosylcobinamide-phosphate synthase
MLAEAPPLLGSSAIFAAHLLLLCCALLLDAVVGYPDALFRAIGHPVTWIGALIAALDRRLPRTRAAGAAALAILLAATVIPAALIQFVLLRALPLPAAIALLALPAASLLAQRSLWTHVAAVAAALEQDGLSAARTAVSRIVGRNPETLDEPAIARAAIESLAENFSDGIVAPALWCAIAGLPGIVLYKAVNTADSMIGHRTPRHEAFGWAAARLDDLINLPASRLSAAFLTLAALLHGAHAAGALRAIRRDASNHRSPNAGWPESAMAGALNLRLAGPRTYGTTRVDDSWMGDGTQNATAADIRRALALYRTACLVQAALVLALTLIAQG